MRRLWLGIAGGTIAGSVVGLAEALFILSEANTGEYGALIYSLVLYGAIGALLGTLGGIGLILLGRFWNRLSDAFAWCLGFVSVACPMGFVIVRETVDVLMYSGQGVPNHGSLIIVTFIGIAALLFLWLGTIFLTRTPLERLLEPKGMGTLIGAAFVLGAVFSFSAPNADVVGNMIPDKGGWHGADESPNVLVIMVDSLRADHLGVYGFPKDISPSIDRFAEESVIFEQAFAHASWTRTSTASLFSSMLPTAHGCGSQVPSLPDEVLTVAEVLREGGYATGGMTSNIDVTRSFNFQQGFDWYSYLDPTYVAGATESASRLVMYRWVRYLRDRVLGGSQHVESFYQPSEVVLDWARRFIDGNAGPNSPENRWFLFAHLMEPHEPYFSHADDGDLFWRDETPMPDREGLEKAKGLYASEVAWMDEQVGLFLQWLKDEGHYDNTLVIITSDHGEEFLDHGGWWHGATLYDEQIHIPLIVKRPNGELSGTRISWQVRQVDIAATIVAATGLGQPARWHGGNLFDEAAIDYLQGNSDSVALPAGLSRAVVSEQQSQDSTLASIRSGGWKYIRSTNEDPQGPQTEELYWVENDPSEQQNLIGRFGARQASLATALREELEWALTGEVSP